MTRPVCPGQWPGRPLRGKAVARATAACAAQAHGGPLPPLCGLRGRPAAHADHIPEYWSARPAFVSKLGSPRAPGAQRASAHLLGEGEGLGSCPLPGHPPPPVPPPRVCPRDPVGRWHLTGTGLARSQERKGWHHPPDPALSVRGEQDSDLEGRTGRGEVCKQPVGAARASERSPGPGHRGLGASTALHPRLACPKRPDPSQPVHAPTPSAPAVPPPTRPFQPRSAQSATGRAGRAASEPGAGASDLRAAAASAPAPGGLPATDQAWAEAGDTGLREGLP